MIFLSFAFSTLLRDRRASYYALILILLGLGGLIESVGAR